MVGLWLLVPEHLRLGTWDLLRQWSGPSTEDLTARIGLQLVHEAAICSRNTRTSRSLTQRGFEILNGLPFLASDHSVHDILEKHTIEEAMSLQLALGCIRRAKGDFIGNLLAIDPHRMRSYSQRQMIRYRDHEKEKPSKVSQAFFMLDADTYQPVCFLIATSAMSVSQMSSRLFELTHRILNPSSENRPLVLADNEHFSLEVFQHVYDQTHFDLMAPMPYRDSYMKPIKSLPSSQFTRRWAGWATTHLPFAFKEAQDLQFCQLIQRAMEKEGEYIFKSFLITRYRDEVDDLSIHFPKRWHIEEFFKFYQDMGWRYAGTQNLNIRYGHASMALLAQAACFHLRQRLGEPFSSWDSLHLASSIFRGVDGDIRVSADTILVTLYNAPHVDSLRRYYENLPSLLEREGVDPRIPWLFNFKLDFRFK